MTLFLLSLAGIPPTVGFVAKVGVFTAAIRAGHTSLALIGVVASVVAAFFYLRVIVLMYMQEPQGSFEEDRSLMPRVAIDDPGYPHAGPRHLPRSDRRDPREGLDPQVVIR